MTKDDAHDDILTPEEAAQYLKVSKSTIYRLAQKGILPGRKVGGSWRFSRRRLYEWMVQDDQPPANDD